jgi:Ca2+-binding RTX toxin-like protein
LIALAGSDIVSGASGDDRLFGGPGRDLLRGGPGSDTIVDSSGRTSVLTGAGGHSGRDSVDVRDGEGDDFVVCANRKAAVSADPGDRVRHCRK